MADRRGGVDLTAGASGILLSPYSDKERFDLSEGQMGEEQSGMASQQTCGVFQKSHYDNRLSAPYFKGSGSRAIGNPAWASTSEAPVPLKYSFEALSHQITCSEGDFFQQTHRVVGRAQDCDSLIVKPKSRLGQDPFPRPVYNSEPNFCTATVGTQPLLFKRAHSCDYIEAHLLNKKTSVLSEGCVPRAH